MLTLFVTVSGSECPLATDEGRGDRMTLSVLVPLVKPVFRGLLLPNSPLFTDPSLDERELSEVLGLHTALGFSKAFAFHVGFGSSAGLFTHGGLFFRGVSFPRSTVLIDLFSQGGVFFVGEVLPLVVSEGTLVRITTGASTVVFSACFQRWLACGV